MNTSYKLNKAKLIRDVTILRTATDGWIPEVTSNDSEQLRILFNKSKKDIKVRGGVQFISDDEMDENNFEHFQPLAIDVQLHLPIATCEHTRNAQFALPV